MDYQSPVQYMIQNGQFGVSSPMQQTDMYNPYMNQQQFNPYCNNMVPINNTFQPQPQPQQQNGYVFQPVNTGYGCYQEPRYNYYDPYGYQQVPYGYRNPYAGYQGYGNYSPFVNPIMQQKMISDQIALTKLKYKIAASYHGMELNEQALDEALNPQRKISERSADEVAKWQNYRLLQNINNLVNSPVQYETNIDRQARYAREYSQNMHDALDHHSMAEFFSDDLWRLERETWIRNNISRRSGRNLSKTYDSAAYNELLQLHKSSNPYVNQLMNNSRYDNNIDDLELGMNVVYDKERRRQAILNGKVPSFISSEETQKRRNAWTNQLLDQIYSKGGRSPNV